MIEGRERADHADHDGHRMRVAAEARLEPGHLLMHHRMVCDQFLKFFILFFCWKLSVEQEMARFDKAPLLGELLDRIAAIKQHALVAVDEGDLRLAARGRGEARIVGEAAGSGVRVPMSTTSGPSVPRRRDSSW